MLKPGSTGAEVKSWQAFLTLQGYAPGPADGVFGPRVAGATRAFQLDHGLATDALVGPATLKVAYDLGWRVAPDAPYPFVPAAHFTPADRGPGDIDWLVVHATDGGEADWQADATAAWLANKTAGGSAHFLVDPKQIKQSVLDKDVAWGAAGANARGIHVEHCGKASQTAAQWDDENSRAILQRAAKLMAELCKKYNVPAIWLDEAAFRRGERGIVSHAVVTKVHPAGNGGHWDPGPGFPVQRYMGWIREELEALG